MRAIYSEVSFFFMVAWLHEKAKQFNTNSRLWFGYMSTNRKLPSPFLLSLEFSLRCQKKTLRVSCHPHSTEPRVEVTVPYKAPCPFPPLSHHVLPRAHEAPATHNFFQGSREASLSKAPHALSLLSGTPPHHTWRALPYLSGFSSVSSRAPPPEVGFKQPPLYFQQHLLISLQCVSLSVSFSVSHLSPSFNIL